MVLSAAVRSALRAVSAVEDLPRGQARPGQDQRGEKPVWPGRIAQYLRAALATAPTQESPHRPVPGSAQEAGPGPAPERPPGPTGWGSYADAVAAVGAACADLDDGDLAGAYLALRAADSALREAATT